MNTEYVILRERDELIELRSDFHYWLLLRNRTGDKSYYLFHKYKACHSYHRQLLQPVSRKTALKYIHRHDEYVRSLYGSSLGI